jgi:glycosyltransferase involved in cell wall biosynthesis
MLSPIGVLLKNLLPVRVSVTIHGLDITYGNSLYQSVIPRCAAQLDRIVCVSKHTKTECAQRGIPTNKCFVIPNGVNSAVFETFESRDECRSDLERRFGVALQGKTILLSVGRLVPRKGVAWFIQEVMPHLDHRHFYLIGGDGPDRERILSLVVQYKLETRVFLVGRVNEETRNRLLHASDMFLMPNVRVDGDVEGFGIAGIEAGCCGLPVIGSDLQGLKDAVLHGRTGFLVEPGNTEGFVNRIKTMDLDRASVRLLAIETFDWRKIFPRYREVLGLSRL